MDCHHGFKDCRSEVYTQWLKNMYTNMGVNKQVMMSTQKNPVIVLQMRVGLDCQNVAMSGPV